MTDVINYNDFMDSTTKDTPPDNLEGVHLALWYAVKDNWNSNYLYRNCNKSTYSGSLKNEY